jgi:hypothetical protein
MPFSADAFQTLLRWADKSHTLDVVFEGPSVLLNLHRVTVHSVGPAGLIIRGDETHLNWQFLASELFLIDSVTVLMRSASGEVCTLYAETSQRD